MVKGIGALLEANPGLLCIVLVKLIYIYIYIGCILGFFATQQGHQSSATL